MTKILPLAVLALLLVGMVMFSRRNKLRAAQADSQRRERLLPGAEVMTTSGLYGTVVTVNDDDTVLLSIAPGVEVKWAIAALREVSELPEQYRAPLQGEGTAGNTAPENPTTSTQAPGTGNSDLR